MAGASTAESEFLRYEQGRASGVPAGLGDALIDIGDDAPDDLTSGASHTEQADGSVLIDLDPVAQSGKLPTEHDANLAEFMTDSELSTISADLLEAIDQDRSSRKDWESILAEGMKLLGLNIEDRSYPFQGACGVYDPLMAEAVFRFQAIARGEMLPAAGPVKSQIVGLATDQRTDLANRKRDWMNLYFTQLAPEYYPDFDQMLLWLPMCGSTFKKVYQNPVLNRPVAPFITPDNFIVAYGTADLITCPRATHIEEMSERQVRQMQLSGEWLDIDLGQPQEEGRKKTAIKEEADASTGITRMIARQSDKYQINEVHCDYEIELDQSEDDAELPLPYRITIDTDSRKVLAIYRNWREDDPMRRKRQCFVHYKFLPGFGFYGYGYAHVLAGAAKASTMITRQLVDSGTLNNFPGGLRVKGMRMDDNNLTIGPMSFPEIDTGGLPIQSAIMTMPYKDPSPVSLQMLSSIRENARNLANTAELAVGEGRQDAPVGTTIALLEASTKVQSAILKRCHAAQREEFHLIADLFGEFLPEQPYPFPVPGGQAAIMRSDFANNNDVIPVSDPNITSSAQRMMKAQAELQMAQSAPQIHDLRAAFVNVYHEMGMDDQQIMQVLPMPQQAQPADPLTENQNVLMNKPVVAAMYQDHDAHIASHQALAAAPPMQAHIAEHMAMKMRVQVQQLLGVQLPPPGAQLPPQIENQIAVIVAKAMGMIQQQAQGQNPAPGDVMQAQLKVDAAKVSQAAEAAQIKAQSEVYKANLNFQAKMAEVQSRENIARVSAFAQMSDNREAPPAFAASILNQ